MDPTRTSNYGPGYLRRICELNKDSDLERIIDLRGQFGLKGSNNVYFPKKAYVINLARRDDRWSRFNSLNNQLFSNFEVERFDAVEDQSDVPWAIFRSYIQVMEKAFEEDRQDSIVVMEDDSYLVPGAIDKIKDSYASLPQDWDILIGNHYFFGKIAVLNEHLAKPINMASTINFSIIRNTILGKIRDNLNMRTADKLDIDHFITSEEVPINNYTIWPMVSREYLSHSDHKGCEKNMEIRIREHAYLFPFIDSHVYYPSLEGW